MATVKSDIVTLLDSTDASKKIVDPSLAGGKLRAYPFSYDTGASGPATGDVIQLVEVPASSRVLAIYVVHEAMTSAGGVAGADFGDSGDADRFVTALDMDAASAGKFLALRHEDANLADKTLGIGYRYASATRIEAKVTGEAWAANKRLDGFVVVSVE